MGGAETSARSGSSGTTLDDWARRFFVHWRVARKWQRLEPYEKFAAMIDRHWDGIAADCCPENTVALGFVEGLNEHLRLKILTCMLPTL